MVKLKARNEQSDFLSSAILTRLKNMIIPHVIVGHEAFKLDH